MANKLNSGGMDKAMTVAAVLASQGRVLTGGFMDEFDREAETQANAMNRVRGMVPRKVGQRKAGFGRPAYHPNRAGYVESNPTFYASLSR